MAQFTCGNSAGRGSRRPEGGKQRPYGFTTVPTLRGPDLWPGQYRDRFRVSRKSLRRIEPQKYCDGWAGGPFKPGFGLSGGGIAVAGAL